MGYSLPDTEFIGKGIIVPELTSVSFVSVDGGADLKFLDKGSLPKLDEAKWRSSWSRGMWKWWRI